MAIIDNLGMVYKQNYDMKLVALLKLYRRC